MQNKQNTQDLPNMEQQLDNFPFQERLKELFFRYAAVESQSRAEAEEVPSSPGQWNLARLLAQDLEALGLQDIHLSEYCVLTAQLPSNMQIHTPDKLPTLVPADSEEQQKAQTNIPKLGWVCHLDTVDVGLSPEIHPVFVPNYQGGDICQQADQELYISAADHPELQDYLGQDLIVSDGSSVLGADNKAAIANIVCALEYLVQHPDFYHGDIYVAFVPDEEIGLRGVRKLDLGKFPVDFAYTIDCCALGELVYETFNAGSAELRIKGVTAHPMSAKNHLVNPLLVGVDFINLLNRAESPEHTEGREGYIWVTDFHADVLHAKLSFNIRDHSKAGYEAKKAYLQEALKLTQLRHPKAELDLQVEDVYSNIADAITDQNRQCLDNLYQAMEELGIEAKTLAMRGGTDGSYLSSQGLPTPNYFTGALNFHASSEFMPMKSVEQSCLTTLKLIEIAARPASEAP